MRRRHLLLSSLSQNTRRPNVVFILVDDLRFDELGATGHPFSQTPAADRLAREGACYTHAFATTPLCSPSRSAFLTGVYSHTNGIIDNVARDAASHRLVTWPRLLHDSGYRTAFMGKWHMGNDDSPRPGFDRWVSFRGQGTCFDPELNIDGRVTATRGYVTDILSDHAVEFIRSARQPFCLYLAHKAIHPNVQQAADGSIDPRAANDAAQFMPAERHRDLYAGRTPPRRGNYRHPPERKPALGSHASTATDDATILNRLRMLKAVDESTGAIVEALEKKGVLDDTIIVFTSDHGYFYGEHDLGPERRLAYEEAIRIPLIVRYPKRFRAGSRPPRLVSSVDIASSVLALTGVPAPQPFHGRPLWAKPERDALLIEYFSDTVFPRIQRMGYRALRTARWKLIHYVDQTGVDELYDLERDPYELDNRINDPRAPRRRLEARLRLLEASPG